MSHATAYAVSMSPPVVEQIVSVLDLLIDDNEQHEGAFNLTESFQSNRRSRLGRKRIDQLAWNTRYFRQRLTKMGFIVYGHPHSPVVPALLYSPSKIAYVGTRCLAPLKLVERQHAFTFAVHSIARCSNVVFPWSPLAFQRHPWYWVVFASASQHRIHRTCSITYVVSRFACPRLVSRSLVSRY